MITQMAELLSNIHGLGSLVLFYLHCSGQDSPALVIAWSFHCTNVAVVNVCVTDIM